ncbi:hypothetical protein BH23GEM9_BH23GEM9_13860 [soil metagenome]
MTKEEKQAFLAGARTMLAGDRIGADFDYLLRTMESDERAEELIDASSDGLAQLTDTVRALVPEKYRSVGGTVAQSGESRRRGNQYDDIRAEVKAEQEAKRSRSSSAADRLEKFGTGN